MPLHVAVALLSAGAAILILWPAIENRTALGAASLTAYGGALLVWAVSLAFYWSNTSSLQGHFWLATSFLGATTAPAALLVYGLQYSGREGWVGPKNLALLAIVPALTQVLILTGRCECIVVENGKAGMLAGIPLTGAWVWFVEVYSDTLVLVAGLLLISTIYRRHRPSLPRPSSVQVGTLLGISISLLVLVILSSQLGLHLTPVGFAIMGLAITHSIFPDRLSETASILRHTVVEGLDEGWMVLDTHNQIVDLNPAAGRLIGLPIKTILGEPAEKVLVDWPNVLKQIRNLRQSEIKGSVNLQDGRRYLNLRLSALIDKHGRIFGHLIMWRDVTERRMVEDARQRARDEMFILLHAISGAATRAMNLEEFLTEANHQMAYSFQSQTSAIFLFEQPAGRAGHAGPTLAAQHGLTDGAASWLSLFLSPGELLRSLLEDREPLLISDIANDSRIPPRIKQGGDKSLLLLPMVVDGKPIGVICLTRREGRPYTADEVARLGLVADEISAFTASDRRRQLTIAFTERQRLVRDLHDSVTQKLYGLLTLTEASQAALESGTAIMSAELLSRFGEGTRQALKEMRLFLYGLQPVDLEREGLVSVLHQRLAAVEGRADVKARLLTDDEINLPLTKEVALYFITQEALNNVLRHANAKSVTVRLKQTDANVLLSVEDDGCGFDPGQQAKAGMGLSNIRERVAQIGGRLRIVSSPGNGTSLYVAVGRETYPNPIQERGN